MLEVIRGTIEKPVSTEELVRFLQETLSEEEGFLYTGYPILSTSIGSTTLDVVLLTENHGMVIFDVIEGVAEVSREEERDELYLNSKARLIQNKALVQRRELCVGLHVVTYAPRYKNAIDEWTFNDNDNLGVFLESIRNEEKNSEHFVGLKSVVQTVTKLKTIKKRLNVTKDNSRGAKLKRIEDSIANLDSKQNQAVIETVKGPQRIRGLAGSGKTIILALKTAYLHSVYPDWDIAVTYNTRSLKGQFVDLITKFTIEQKGEEPDWDKIKIMNAWGSVRNPGMYSEFCLANEVPSLDFGDARRRYGNSSPFAHICHKALSEAKRRKNIVKKYDVILIDEAQDFAHPFLSLCYEFLKDPKRLVWAYDELQNLSSVEMLSPMNLFGIELKNEVDSPKQDIILDKCYRNPGPVLVTAHSLGFGMYREEGGLVQMFDHPSLWKDIGYNVTAGELSLGSEVTLERGSDASPKFLQEHSDIDDLIIFKSFKNQSDQADWLIKQISNDLEEEELTHRDIVIINLDPRTIADDTALLREKLFAKGVNTHIAGVTTAADSFFEKDSITFTSIFRAKGNEAPMVYIIDGHKSYGGGQLRNKRNKLFSAITRSKAWVRVTGIGPEMDALCSEYEKIKEKNFTLKFTYPTEEEMKKLLLIHRDLTDNEIREREESNKSLLTVVGKLKKGEMDYNDGEGLRQLKAFFDEQKGK